MGLFDSLDHSSDLDAINTYIMSTPAASPGADAIQKAWAPWYNANSGTFVSDDTWNEARSRRNAFQLANAVTPEQQAGIKNVLATSVTPEELQGKPRPIIDVNTGKVTPVPAAGKTSLGVPVGTPGASNHPTLRQGASGPDVTLWQSIVGVTEPNFGPATLTATKNWQSAHGLTADGIVGPKTWSAATGKPVLTTTPAPAIATFAPAPKSPTPAPLPPTAIPGVIAAVTNPVKPITAGLNPANWPVWGKVAGGVAAASILGGALLRKR